MSLNAVNQIKGPVTMLIPYTAYIASLLGPSLISISEDKKAYVGISIYITCYLLNLMFDNLFFQKINSLANTNHQTNHQDRY